jgi:CsoR family transcriptional regulator, copper-sensing transcriptional repressor
MQQDKTNLKNRALSIHGHVGAVVRMIDQGAYCIDIIKQTQAIQKAIDRLNAMILDDHLNSCVTTAIRGDKPKERERVLKELLDVFETSAKL